MTEITKLTLAEHVGEIKEGNSAFFKLLTHFPLGV